MPFPPKGILQPGPSRFAIRALTSSQTALTTSENFRLTVIGGGCGGNAGNRGGPAAGQAIKTFRGIPIGTPITAVIGALGIGGTSGGGSPTSGGDTTVTVRGQPPIVCQGGQTTGVGGTASGGDVNITGQRPGLAFFTGTGLNLYGGNGGDTILGFGGRHNGTPSDAGAIPGTGYGAGGAGGYFNSGTGTSFTAGDGTPGICIIEDL